MRVRIALAVLGVVGAVVVPVALGGGGAPGVLQGSKGVVAPSGAVRYVAFSRAGGTVVAAVLTSGGQVARFRWLRGTYGVPIVAVDGATEGVTRDGKTLVLAPAVGPGATRSRFALVDTKTLRVRRFVTLAGSFSYDALSPDGQTVYLIETLGNGATYRVRAYDLAAGRLLRRVIVDPHEADEPMIGTPATRVTSTDGRWVYTLYVRPEQPPFIHALDARNRAARCIDLPWEGSQDAIWGMRLKLSRDGSQLVLRDGAGEAAVVVNTRTFRARPA
jgi:hypothetical protein